MHGALLEAPDAPEEVELPCADPHAEVVLPDDLRPADHGEVGRHPLRAHVAECRDGGEEGRPLYPVKAPSPLYVQRRYPQVPVVREGGDDDLLHVRIRVEIAPADVCRRRRRLYLLRPRVGRACRPACRDGRRRPRIFRHHRAPGQQDNRKADYKGLPRHGRPPSEGTASPGGFPGGRTVRFAFSLPETRTKKRGI